MKAILPSEMNEEQTFRTDHAVLAQAFSPKALLVAFDAFGDLLFFNSKKK